MKHIIILTIIFIYVLASCQNTNQEDPLNPNGDSELAILMRQMYDDGMLVKEALLEDKKISLILQHTNILTAEATEPKKAGSDEYKAFANHYLQLAKQLNDPNNINKKETCTSLVNSCTACHKAMCPGPLVKINKMALE